MKQIGGSRQFLLIDLVSEEWRVEPLKESTLTLYGGGEALALYLYSLYKEEEALAIACGSFAGSAVAGTNSLSLAGETPLRDRLESATMFTQFAPYLASCGFKAVVIVGSARREMVLTIRSNNVDLTPSERLVGKGVYETLSAVKGKDSSSSSVLAIGVAGERKIGHSTLVSDEFATERRGFGALLGAKHIKAVAVVSSVMEYTPFDESLFNSSYKELLHDMRKSPALKQIKRVGPLDFINQAQKRGFAAVDSFTKRSDIRLFHLSREEWERKYPLSVDSCSHCPIACKRVILEGEKGHFLVNPYSVLALGSNLGNYDTTLIQRWWSRLIDVGIEPVSAGVLIGEKLERSGDSFCEVDVPLIDSMIEQMATGEFDSQDFELAPNRLPVVPIDVRGEWGSALLMGLEEDFPFACELLLNWRYPKRVAQKAYFVSLQEILLATLRSFGICPYIMVPYLFEKGGKSLIRRFLTGRPTSKITFFKMKLMKQLASSLMGIEFSEKQLIDIGRRAISLKRSLLEQNSLPSPIPKRFMSVAESNFFHHSTVPYHMLVDYYRFFYRLNLAKLEEE